MVNENFEEFSKEQKSTNQVILEEVKGQVLINLIITVKKTRINQLEQQVEIGH